MVNEPKTVIDSVRIQQIKISAYKIPTDTPAGDGTLRWNSTTLVLVELEGGGYSGLGYTYADAATAEFIHNSLAPYVKGENVFDIERITSTLIRQIRNSGTCGIAMMAVSAVDNALWDLKAKLLHLPLCKLIGQCRDEMVIYGSGGFTTYNKEQLQQQFRRWAETGIRFMKMKVGADPAKDISRIQYAREAIGNEPELMIDANGAYTVRQAINIAREAKQLGVTWFEEPVSSDNLQGLHFIRDHVEMNIAAGEYGYNLPYFEAMLAAGAVDVLQADATRCGGITGFIKAGHLAAEHQVPFSSHCAPALHLHAVLSLPAFFVAEYFHDHVRIEQMLFDGCSPPVNGALRPDLSRPGIGVSFKHKDAEKYKI
jgi:L-alanine-DL-glutamate epimerase-like enolase superfamily enzyme